MSKPFARYHAILTMLATVNSLYGGAKAQALSQIPEYRSRGKNKSSGMRKASNAGNNCNNTSMLHDYKRESTRRLEQKQFQNWLALQNNKEAV